MMRNKLRSVQGHTNFLTYPSGYKTGHDGYCPLSRAHHNVDTINAGRENKTYALQDGENKTGRYGTGTGAVPPLGRFLMTGCPCDQSFHERGECSSRIGVWAVEEVCR